MHGVVRTCSVLNENMLRPFCRLPQNVILQLKCGKIASTLPVHGMCTDNSKKAMISTQNRLKFGVYGFVKGFFENDQSNEKYIGLKRFVI